MQVSRCVMAYWRHHLTSNLCEVCLGIQKGMLHWGENNSFMSASSIDNDWNKDWTCVLFLSYLYGYVTYHFCSSRGIHRVSFLARLLLLQRWWHLMLRRLMQLTSFPHHHNQCWGMAHCQQDIAPKDANIAGHSLTRAHHCHWASSTPGTLSCHGQTGRRKNQRDWCAESATMCFAQLTVHQVFPRHVILHYLFAICFT